MINHAAAGKRQQLAYFADPSLLAFFKSARSLNQRLFVLKAYYVN
jgi:hypothetical protein